jgi:Response regulator containing CheY-like receiver domain and AraC-type DNA-binding domain
MKAMIVEDEILVRLGLRKAIPWSSLGMELVCEAQDGDEACLMYDRHRPDIVLVDIEMPRSDGLQFIRYAKSLRAGSRFVVLTCHQDMKYMREAIQLQVNDFILKSTLDMDDLCGILRRLATDLERERSEAATEAPIAIGASAAPKPAELDFYGLTQRAAVPEEALLEILSAPSQALRKEIDASVGSLQFALARRKLYELRSEFAQGPLHHPHVIKNTMTEFLFRAWSACEELPDGKQAANHRLVDQLYAAVRLEEVFQLLERELDRLEGLSELTNSADDREKVIHLVKQYIRAHLAEEITLQEIANAFYINSSYLSRLFKEVSRMSFTEFVLFEKTEQAILLMKNGKSLTEISERLGYLNLSSFTRMFKKVRGASPSKYSRG